MAFTRALGRPCNYVFDPKINIRVPVPSGYHQQLRGIEILFGQMRAPYFPGPEFTRRRKGSTSSTDTNEGSEAEPRTSLVQEARQLWQGWRGMEEYAREAFPIEEEANGMDWMVDKTLT